MNTFLKQPLSKDALIIDGDIRCHQAQMEGLLRQMGQACIQYALAHHMEFYSMMLRRINTHFEAMQNCINQFDLQIQKDTEAEAKKCTMN